MLGYILHLILDRRQQKLARKQARAGIPNKQQPVRGSELRAGETVCANRVGSGPHVEVEGRLAGVAEEGDRGEDEPESGRLAKR